MIGAEGARGLGDALKTNTTLTVLELESEQQDHKQTQRESKASATAPWFEWADNYIGDEGARGLGEALKTNTTLTILDLGSEQQDHKEAQQEQGKHNGMGVTGQSTRFVLKERVGLAMHSKQTQH